jgi:TPR repeat protein
MAVLVEALSVIIREPSLRRDSKEFSNFKSNIPLEGFCSDGNLHRVAFMQEENALAFASFLEDEFGLKPASQNGDGDFVLVNMETGPTVKCEWIDFLRDDIFSHRKEYENHNKDFSIVWAKFDSERNSHCTKSNFKEEGICVPENWNPDNAILNTSKDNVEVIKVGNGVKTLKNKPTGEITYVPVEYQFHSEEQLLKEKKLHVKLLIEKAQRLYHGYGTAKSGSTSLRTIDHAIVLALNTFDNLDEFDDLLHEKFDKGNNGALDFEMFINFIVRRPIPAFRHIHGMILLNPEYDKSDLYEAINELSISAKFEYIKSIYQLALLYSDEKSKIFDIPTAIAYCKQAIELNHAKSEELLKNLEQKYGEVDFSFLEKTIDELYIEAKMYDKYLDDEFINKIYKIAEKYVTDYCINTSSGNIILENSDKSIIDAYTQIIKIEIERATKLNTNLTPQAIEEKVIDNFYNYVGDRFYYNNVGTCDLEIADKLLEITSNYGHAKSLVLRAYINYYEINKKHESRAGDISSRTKAIELLERAIDLNHENAYLILIKLLSDKEYKIVNYNKAIEICRKGIEKGLKRVEVELLPLTLQKENSSCKDDAVLLFSRLNDCLEYGKKDVKKCYNKWNIEHMPNPKKDSLFSNITRWDYKKKEGLLNCVFELEFVKKLDFKELNIPLEDFNINFNTDECREIDFDNDSWDYGYGDIYDFESSDASPEGFTDSSSNFTMSDDLLKLPSFKLIPLPREWDANYEYKDIEKVEEPNRNIDREIDEARATFIKNYKYMEYLYSDFDDAPTFENINSESILRQILDLAERDNENDDFIEELYVNVKNRLNNISNITESKLKENQHCIDDFFANINKK